MRVTRVVYLGIRLRERQVQTTYLVEMVRTCSTVAQVQTDWKVVWVMTLFTVVLMGLMSGGMLVRM